MKKAETACGDAVRNQIGPELELAVAAVLGKRESPWFEFLTDVATNSPVLPCRGPARVGQQPPRRAESLDCSSPGLR